MDENIYKRIDMNSQPSIATLNMNDLNTPVKRDCPFK